MTDKHLFFLNWLINDSEASSVRSSLCHCCVHGGRAGAGESKEVNDKPMTPHVSQAQVQQKGQPRALINSGPGEGSGRCCKGKGGIRVE